MLNSSKIITLHPAKKMGVSINREKYEIVKKVILSELNKKEQVGFSEIVKTANRILNKNFEGKVTWYVVTVKLDLEARGLIERTNNKGRQALRLRRE